MSGSRYPGAQPFRADQGQVFFGRAEDVQVLQRKVKLSQMTILYGKSGLGKSSLINAGLLPKLDQEKGYLPVRVRFNAWQAEAEALPVEKTCAAILEQTAPASFLNKIISRDDSIWRRIKDQTVSAENDRSLLLIFDQFEELFTYPAAAILEFRRQLAESLYTPAPQRYWDVLEAGYEAGQPILSPEEEQRFQAPPDVKVLIAIRSDRMHLLEKLSDFLPTILSNCQELEPLDEQRARTAIVKPALLSGDFESPDFSYTPAALDHILQFLTEQHTEPIETTQLQIICRHLEQHIGRTNAPEITLEEVQDLDQIIEDYYESRIRLIQDPQQALAAQRLVEEGLVFEEEERRLNMYEGQILRSFGLTTETLRILVDSHLLRAEPSLRGGYTYELSHDTLVGPVLRSKTIRHAAEQAAEAERQRRERAAELAVERKKRRNAYLIALIMLILAAAAVAAAITARQQKQRAEAAQVQILQNTLDIQKEKANSLKKEGRYAEALQLISDIRTQWVSYSTLIPQQQEMVLRELDSLAGNWNELRVLVERAQGQVSDGAYRAAVELLEQALMLSPDTYLENLLNQTQEELERQFRFLLNNGDLRMSAFRFQDAAEQYREALKLKPNDDIALQKLARAENSMR